MATNTIALSLVYSIIMVLGTDFSIINKITAHAQNSNGEIGADDSPDFKPFAFSSTANGQNYTIHGRAQSDIQILKFSILSGLGIYIDINTEQGGLMELTLQKEVIEDVSLVEASYSDIQVSVTAKKVLVNDTATIIRFNVPAGTYNVDIKGTGGVVPEFPLIPVMILGLSIVLVLVIARLRSLTSFAPRFQQ